MAVQNGPSLGHEVSRHASRFGSDTRGNIPLLAAFLAIPTIAMVSLGIDHARAAATRQALDAAANVAVGQGLVAAHLAMEEAARTTSDPVTLNAIGCAAEKKAATDSFTSAVGPLGVEIVSISFKASLCASDSGAVATRMAGGDIVSGEDGAQQDGSNLMLSYIVKISNAFGSALGLAKSDIKGQSNAAPRDAATHGKYVFEDSFKMPLNGHTSADATGYNDWHLHSNGACKSSRSSGAAAVARIGLASFLDPAGQHAAGREFLQLRSGCDASLSHAVTFPSSGRYELIYTYKSRRWEDSIAPVAMCGTEAADLDEIYVRTDETSDRVDVYLDAARSTQPASSSPLTDLKNHIDGCLSSQKWVTRRVELEVPKGQHRLTLRAEGAYQKWGALIGDVVVCAGKCNRPDTDAPVWPDRTTIFADTFTPDTFARAAAGHTAAEEGQQADGRISGTLDRTGEFPGYAAPNGAPHKLSEGWATTPVNQMDFYPLGQGHMIELNGTHGSRAITRRFILAPGHYALNYTYGARAYVQWSGTKPEPPQCDVQMYDKPGHSLKIVSQYMITDPRPGHHADADAYYNEAAGAFYPWNPQEGAANFPISSTTSVPPNSDIPRRKAGSFRYDVNQMGVYLDSGRIHSHPQGSPLFYGKTEFRNPDGTSLISEGRTFHWKMPAYAIDLCLNTNKWLDRSIGFAIKKPGLYWITFRAEGPGGDVGALLANVSLVFNKGLQPADIAREKKEDLKLSDGITVRDVVVLK